MKRLKILLFIALFIFATGVTQVNAFEVGEDITVNVGTYNFVSALTTGSTTAIVNVDDKSFSGTIKNTGNLSYSGDINYYFEIKNSSSGSVVANLSSKITGLNASETKTVSTKYKFTNTGNYSVRLCAVKPDSITETSSTDNCSSSISVSVNTITVTVNPVLFTEDVSRTSDVSFAYTSSTNTGNGTECALLDYQSGILVGYQTTSPLVTTPPSAPGAYAYYIRCRDRVYTETNPVTSYSIYIQVKPVVSFFKNDETLEGNYPYTFKETNLGGSVGTLPASPTRTGYFFSGWNTSSSGRDGYTFLADTGVGEDLNVYALWSQNQYTVSTSSGTGISFSPTSALVPYGSTTTFTVTPSTGFRIDSVTGCGGTLSGNKYTTGAISSACTVSGTAARIPMPDLTSSTSSPTSATIGVAQTYSATITNQGDATTNIGFPYFFQVANDSSFSSGLVNKEYSMMTALAPSASKTATVSHTFSSTGTYYMRVCADKDFPSAGGAITESNENNNCGSPTAIVVSNPPVSGSLSGSSSCAISFGGDNCSTQINWSISYPEGSETAITYNNMQDGEQSVKVSSSITPNKQSGTAIVYAYYNNGGPREFYLYNNAKLLSTISIAAYCNAGGGLVWSSDLQHCVLQTYTVSTYVDGLGGAISPASATPVHGSTSVFTLIPDSANGYVVDSVTGCGGTLSGNKYTTGEIYSACTVTAKFKKMTGNIAPDSPSCVIPLGAKDCSASLSWSTTDPIGTSAVTSPAINVNGVDYPAISESGNSGTKSFLVPHGSRNFFLYNNALQLDQATATAECNSVTSIWNGSVCAPSSGTLTAKGCSIEKDHNSCDVSLTWSTLHPIVTSAVTTPNNVTVANANEGTANYNMSCEGFASIDDCDRNFYLYNGGEPPLAIATILGSSGEETGTSNISCASETIWNSTSRKCVYQAPILSFTAPACKIPVKASSCTTNITWNTEYPAKGVKSVLKSGLTTLATGNDNSLAGYPDGYNRSISLGTTEFTLTNGSSSLTKEATATCVTDAHWEGGRCIIDLPSEKNTIFEAIPNTVIKGKSSVLNWSSSVATTCNIKDGNTGAVVASGISGTTTVTPQKTTTYTLTCTNETGTSNNPLLIKVITLNIKEN